MPAPSSYTEKTLAEFMLFVLGKVGQVLDLHTDPEGPGDFEEAINDALLAYGTSDISSIGSSGIEKLRALARVSAWRMVVENFAAYYAFSADGSTYQRDQLLKNAKEALVIAEGAAAIYSGEHAGKIVSITHSHDPYKVWVDDEFQE